MEKDPSIEEQKANLLRKHDLAEESIRYTSHIAICDPYICAFLVSCA